MDGKDLERDPKGYLMLKDGATWKKIVQINHFPEIVGFRNTQSGTFPITRRVTLTISLGKHYRCRSRKRLVKLIMGEGFDKRTAEDADHAWNVCGYSYQMAWSLISFWIF